MKLFTLVTGLSLTALSSAFAQGAGRPCAADYYRFCSHTTPRSAEMRACFMQNRASLSPECMAAGQAARKQFYHRSAR